MNDFTLADLLAFARSKPADEEYDVTDADYCALGQFGEATGRDYLRTAFNPDKSLGFVGLNEALGFDNDYEKTFGALVTRLEALVQEAPAKPSPWLSPQTYIEADCGQYDALAAATGTAKTPKVVECEASQSGPKGNAQNTPSEHS